MNAKKFTQFALLILVLLGLSAMLTLVVAADSSNAMLAPASDANLEPDIIPNDFFAKSGDVITFTVAMTSTSPDAMPQVVMTDD